MYCVANCLNSWHWRTSVGYGNGDPCAWNRNEIAYVKHLIALCINNMHACVSLQTIIENCYLILLIKSQYVYFPVIFFFFPYIYCWHFRQHTMYIVLWIDHAEENAHLSLCTHMATSCGPFWLSFFPKWVCNIIKYVI